ncbi:MULTISPECIES: DUF1598 domain-containing protein [unclassified Schlesneria]|uniref:DUF1598 domain-containing protein n=1 Tax=unclassified Schlesneria TaxID=2762017 RepID=UPI002EE1B5F5
MVRFGRLNFNTTFLHRSLTLCGCLIAMSTASQAANSPAQMNHAAVVADHLSAGEFGLALDQALVAPTPEERAALLTQVAAAQQAAGETDAAAGTLKRIPRRSRLENAPAAPRALQGGVQADFQTLMRLIRENTKSKWEEEDGEGGAMSPFPTGVKVSPTGLLHRVSAAEQSGELASLGVKARQADINEDVAQYSELRMVSLTRLERAVARRIEEGLPVPETMSQLAGLSHIKYVFAVPESNEIVIAGPAAGWQYNEQGQPVSVRDGQPTLQLDDLVTVLRTFARGNADFGCSINTRDEGVKALKEFVEKSQAKGPINKGGVGAWVNQIQQKLGRQDVVVWGVPAESRVARVIVEADYRMKLIGINKLPAGKEIPGYFDLLPVAEQKAQPNMDALRWWLTIQCDAVMHSEDRNTFEIQGSSVLCLSENQLVTAEGKHVPTGKSEPTNRLFAQNFTSHYATLAKKDLVFADAQNIFNMALCSALIQSEDLRGKTGWNMGVFAPNGGYAPASYPAATEVESVVNHRVYRGRDIVVQAAGGVRCDVMALAKDPVRNKLAPQLEETAKVQQVQSVAVGRWWWDAVK